MDGWGKKRHSGLVTRLDAGGRMRHPPNFLRNVVPSFFTQFDESYILLGKLASVKKFFYGNIEPLRLASPRFLAQSFPRFESIRACSATSFGRVFSPRFFRKIVCEGKVSGKVFQRRARVIFSRCGLWSMWTTIEEVFFFFLEGDLWGLLRRCSERYFRDTISRCGSRKLWLWNVELEDYRVWKFLWVFLEGEWRCKEDSWKSILEIFFFGV